MISVTLVLYRDALKEAGRAFSRSTMVWLLPLVILVTLRLVWIPLSLLGVVGLGILAGLLHFVLESWMWGAYLYLVSESFSRRKPLTVSDIRDSLGQNMREVMGLLFVFWILQLALGMALSNGQIGEEVVYAVILGTAILFNPGPEIIHQERSVGSMDILARSFRWMSTNGPEWLPNLILTGLVLFPLVWAQARWDLLIAAGLFLHPWMLFRAALYRGLGQGTRRSRAWRSRF
jgi:hypothetical protein